METREDDISTGRPVVSVELTPELEDAFNLALSERRHRGRKVTPNSLQSIVQEALTFYFREAGFI